MRGILGVVLSACLLVGCGRVEEEQVEQVDGAETPTQFTICSAGCEQFRRACLAGANGNAAAQEMCMEDYRDCIAGCTPWREGAEAARKEQTEQEQRAARGAVDAPLGPPPVHPYCFTIDDTYCSPSGATRLCRGATSGLYTCTCRDGVYGPSWDCPDV